MTETEGRDLVTIREAATSTGIAERTLRYWIQNGRLPATAGKRGKLVSMGAVRQIGRLTGKIPAGENTTGSKRETSTGSTADTAIATEQARQQLEAIRDEWLQPLIDQIRELEQDKGRLETENAFLQQQLEVSTEAEAETSKEFQHKLRDAVSVHYPVGVISGITVAIVTGPLAYLITQNLDVAIYLAATIGSVIAVTILVFTTRMTEKQIERLHREMEEFNRAAERTREERRGLWPWKRTRSHEGGDRAERDG